MKKFVWFVAFIILIMIGASAIAATITFDNDSVSIQKGKSIIINARIDDLPEGIKAGKFTWISTDESVATCKNGKVIAHEEGEATIVCASYLSDGTNIYSNCKVNVYIPVSSISVPQKTITVQVNDYAIQNLSFKPNNATNQTVTYTSSDPDVIQITTGGKPKAISPGKAIITVMAKDGSNKNTKYTVIVTDKLEFPNNIAVGDLVYFGNYYQLSPKTEKTPIEWVVLERADNKVLLITTHILEYLPFNSSHVSHWPDSSIRKWLNTTFFNTAFQPKEKKSVLATKHTAHYTILKYKSTDGETKAISDKVFLLDESEAQRYFGFDSFFDFDNSDYKYIKKTAPYKNARPTDLAANPYGPPAKGYWDYDTWLLRSTYIYYDEYESEYIPEGKFLTYSCDQDDTQGIRPCITIDLNKVDKNVIIKK